MKVICAWCEREGVETLLGEVGGSEEFVSHGICQEHKEKLLEEATDVIISKNKSQRRRRRRRH